MDLVKVFNVGILYIVLRIYFRLTHSESLSCIMSKIIWDNIPLCERLRYIK